MPLLLLILIPFAGSALAALLPADARNREAWLAFGLTLAGLIGVASLYPDITDGGVVRAEAAWLPAFGLNLVLRLDGLAWLFCLLVLGIGLLVILYARYYLSAQDPVPRFFAFLMAFMGAMLGVVLSGNLIQLVLFWELTSLTSFLLIGYWHHREDARRGARMAFTVTAGGGFCLLAGILLLGHVAGSYDLDIVLAAGDQVRAHPWYLPILFLIALGALSKSAQFPFHFWLPHAMAAPTPVSAYLHSATMVKAGVFLLMRLWPVLAGTDAWHWLIGLAGGATMLIGAWNAIFQSDLKGLLAYSTIAHLGLITTLLGIGTPLALVAAVFHTANHATFKASLFMAAGIIDHESGTRDIRVLRGLAKAMPFTSSLAIVASGAMAGVPLLNGFLSKEMFFSETLQVGGNEHWWLSLAAVLMGLFSVVYSLRFCYIFFGPLSQDLPRVPHEPPHWMRFPVEFLVLCCLVVGVIPALSIGPLLDTAVFSVLRDAAPEYSLAVWHGFNTPLLMSMIALLGGITFYLLLRRRFDLASRSRSPLFPRFSGKQAYENIMLGMALGARRLTSWLGTARLQPQLGLLVAAFLVLPLLVVLLRGGTLPALALPRDWSTAFALLWLIGCVCALVGAWQAKYHRLAALCLVSGTGIVTSMTFLWLSAPDLALTQLMVETVTTVLVLLGLRWLPPRIAPLLPERVRLPVRLRRLRDFAVALAAGLSMTLLSYAVLTRDAGPGLGDFFLENALPGGGGSNAVNVLLVDFRGFDTFGEITVLCIVALTVYALLRRFRPAPESLPLPAQQTNPVDPATLQAPHEQANSGYLLIPGIYIRLLLPIILLVAAFAFMRGHNLPGGGFVAGLIFAVAIILQYMLAGTQWVEARLRSRPHIWLGIGLLLAAATGLGAYVLGYPFLTSHTLHLQVPLLGEVHLPSAFLFDLGVFAVVVGSTLLMLIALAHQSIRGHRQAAPPVAPGGPAAAFTRENS